VREALLPNLRLAAERRCPIVLGTTGLEKEHWEALAEYGKRIPVLHSPNFSIGMAALQAACTLVSSLLEEFSCSIVETHHIRKKDRPSGSALALQKAVEEGDSSRHPPIESLRIGEEFGEHTVSFVHTEEQITLSHKALSRVPFAAGALKAAKFLLRQQPGLYGMSDLLKNTRFM
jgi:4-hydroxy-tetrahydrodipicolinate reductase